MAVVDTDHNMSVDFIIRACIEESGQAGLTVGRPARVAEGPRLEYAAARVPEVIAIRQRQEVDIRTDRKRLRRPQNQLPEGVAVVHHVEEGEAGIEAWSRQNLEEGAVGAVVGVAITGSVVETSAQPRTEGRQHRRLPAGFRGQGAGPLREPSP